MIQFTNRLTEVVARVDVLVASLGYETFERQMNRNNSAGVADSLLSCMNGQTTAVCDLNGQSLSQPVA